MRTALAVAILAALPLLADDDTQLNDISVGVGQARFDEEIAESTGEPTLSITYARYWTEHFATRLGIVAIDQEVTLEVDGPSGGVEVSPIVFSAEYHLLRDRRVSPWAGLGVAWAPEHVGPGKFDNPFMPESKLTSLFSGGVDVTVTKLLAVGAEVSYMPYEPEFGTIGKVEVNPLIVAGTLRFRW